MFDWLQRPNGPPRQLPVVALVIAVVIAAAVSIGNLTLVVIVAALATIVAIAAAWRICAVRRERSGRSVNKQPAGVS
jgi:hypothetical protein